MSEFERRFGKYAIPNLSLILIICYVAGYIIQLLNSSFLNYLTLNPYAILHGQVWRLVTWIVIPPDSLDFFTILMLIFYFSIGTSLERTWGAYRYNVYILGGMLMTVISAFVCMGGCYLFYGNVLGESSEYASSFFAYGSLLFSTYYINMSIFLAYAATFPDNQVLLMFVIPIKVKWLGIAYSVLLIVNLLSYVQAAVSYPMYWFGVVAIGVSLLNFLLFWLRTRNLMNLNPKQVKRRAQFRQQMKAGEHMSAASHGHRCSICGRTDADDPTLEFRYCSKCKGNHEYCQYHLFTHEHIK